MPKNKSAVEITTRNVQVNQTTSKNKNQTKRSKASKRQNNKDHKANGHTPAEDIVPEGIQTGLSMLYGDSSGNRGRSAAVFAKNQPVSFQASEFFRLYCDPNGEHTMSLDAARCADGALQTSSPGFFRVVETIAFPWQQRGRVDLAGLTYSMLFLQYPLFRTLTIILAIENDGEFDDGVMSRFARVFSSILPDKAVYPAWTYFGSGEYFTLIETEALANILPPNEVGESGIIDAYRLTSQGLSVYFNTPDLVDQGTYVSHRYPVDASVHALVDKIVPNFGNPEYIGVHVADNSITQRTATIESTVLPQMIFSFATSGNSNSGTTVSTVTLRNANNSFTLNVGDNFQYQVTTTGVAPTGTQTLRIVNTTLNSSTILMVLPLPAIPGVNFGNSIRLYRTDGDGEQEEVIDEEVTLLTFPPITQADILQQNPKAVVELAKDTGGVYLPTCLMQPIFKITSASEYRKVIFATKTVELDPNELWSSYGYSDTVYDSFSVNVINFQGIPYACKPMIKICRSAELVASPRSILGITTTGTPEKDEEVVTMCQAFHECQPHGYPVNYNGLGILFGKALSVVNALPQLLRVGNNVARAVKEVCEQEAQADAVNPSERLLADGLKRLMRVK